MKKIYSKIFFALALLINSFALLSQTISDELQYGLDLAFENVDLSEVSSGYLYDKTYHMSTLERISGNRDTSLGANAWENIYSDLYRMILNNFGMMQTN